MLDLQRSAGNRATAALITQAPEAGLQLKASETQGQMVVQRSIMSWLKKKLGIKPKVSAPTEDSHAMTEEEQGGVPSAKDLQDLMEKGGKTGGGLTDESAEDAGSFMAAQEHKREEQEKQEARDKAERNDTELFEAIKKAAADVKDPTKTKPEDRSGLSKAFKVVQDAVLVWKNSPNRKLGLDGEKDRQAEIDKIMEDLNGSLDKDKAEGAVVEPNPELKSGDATGYFLAKDLEFYKVMPDGSLATSSSHFNTDQTLADLPEVAKNGKDGYTFKAGPATYWIEKGRVVIKHGGFNKVAGPLFAKDPTPDDVKQSTLGDCYLQAAIASLADKDPGAIKAMMRDNGDETVTVRLFKVDETDEKNHKFDPAYVRVEKSVPKDSAGQEVYNTGAIWVRLIEKAYAAGGFMGQGGKAPPTTLSYEGIAGGFSRYALEVLTGKPSKTMTLNEGPSLESDGNYYTNKGAGQFQSNLTWNDKQRAGVPWDAAEVTNAGLAKTADNYDNLVSFKILKDKGKVDSWITWVKTDKLKTMFTKRNTERSGGYANQITLADIDTVFKDGLDSGIATTMLSWIETQKLYPGKLGTGKYSQMELDAFAKIKERLDAGGMVTASTFTHPAHTSSGTGASGGEAMSGGVVGGHAFTVLAYRASGTSDPADTTGVGDFYWVKIRNPWGSYGRKYDFSQTDPGQEVKGGDGVSWLELSDLTKYFSNIDYN